MPELEDNLKITTGYNDVYLTRDAIGLLDLIRDVAHDHTEDKNEVMAANQIRNSCGLHSSIRTLTIS